MTLHAYGRTSWLNIERSIIDTRELWSESNPNLFNQLLKSGILVSLFS